jgi:hypothetical protein
MNRAQFTRIKRGHSGGTVSGGGTPPPPPPPSVPPLGANIVATPAYGEMGIKVTACSAPSATNSDGLAIRYKKSADSSWLNATKLVWDSRFSWYLGSVLWLDPGTSYDFELTHDDGRQQTFTASTKTLPKDLPIGTTTNVASRQSLLTLTASDSGTGSGWHLYKGAADRSVIFDAQRTRQYCLKLTGAVKNVIFYGIRFTGALNHATLLGTSESSNSDDISDIIFINCGFDNWGSRAGTTPYGINLQSGCYSASTKLKNIDFFDCWFHDPHYSANTWLETNSHGNTHPEGPQAISFKGSKGGHNVLWSTVEMVQDTSMGFNDSMGETNNFSDGGFPYGDTTISHCWLTHLNDDSCELEGHMENVRFLKNFSDKFYQGMGLAPTYRGPVYVVGNVYGESRTARPPATDNPQSVLKSRRLSTKGVDYGGGRLFFIGNTAFTESGSNGVRRLINETSAGDNVSNVVLVNNIIQQTTNTPCVDISSGTGNEIHHNLFRYAPSISGTAARGTSFSNTNGQNPTYNATGTSTAPSPDRTARTIDLRLKSTSAGYNAATSIANLHEGADMGAHQSADSNLMKFGHINFPASWVPSW